MARVHRGYGRLSHQDQPMMSLNLPEISRGYGGDGRDRGDGGRDREKPLTEN